jgi:hypothetical protein
MTFILRKVIKLYLQRTEGEENSGKYWNDDRSSPFEPTRKIILPWAKL